jgi:hypothetical protein
MQNTFYLAILFTTLSISQCFAQENALYIKRGVFTKVLSVSSNTNHGDNILIVNVFYQIGQKVPWGKSQTIISYRYLGIDNQNNLHLQREQSGENFPTVICTLIFALDANKAADITLIAERSQKEPLLIKLHIEANNNGITTKYLGNLPLYKE